MRNISDTLDQAPQSGCWYVGSIVVQAYPDKIDAVKHALLQLPLTEVHGENRAEGKLVVVMESDFQRELANRMESARDIEGVIAVSLIYSELAEQS